MRQLKLYLLLSLITLASCKNEVQVVRQHHLPVPKPLGSTGGVTDARLLYLHYFGPKVAQHIAGARPVYERCPLQ